MWGGVLVLIATAAATATQVPLRRLQQRHVFVREGDGSAAFVELHSLTAAARAPHKLPPGSVVKAEARLLGLLGGSEYKTGTFIAAGNYGNVYKLSGTRAPPSKVAASLLQAKNKKRLIAFYHEHNPDKANDHTAIDKVLHVYKGREHELFDDLHAKYNVAKAGNGVAEVPTSEAGNGVTEVPTSEAADGWTPTEGRVLKQMHMEDEVDMEDRLASAYSKVPQGDPKLEHLAMMEPSFKGKVEQVMSFARMVCALLAV